MKTQSNFMQRIGREAGEIIAFLKPGSARIAGLILVAFVTVFTVITLAFPLISHPQGAAGYLAGLLLSFCAPDTACQFEQVYPPFALFVLVVITTFALFVIILHMYSHRWDPDPDEMDTYIKAMDQAECEFRDDLNFRLMEYFGDIDKRFDDIEALINIDIALDQSTLDQRITENGNRS